MKKHILVLSSLVLAFACDKVERDWSKCNEVNHCKPGDHCESYRCVPNGADASPTSDGSAAPAETASDRPQAPDAAPDVPERTVDASGIEPDSSLADAPLGLASDAPTGDAPRNCGTDEDCPSDFPLCQDSLCVQCKSSSDCSGQDDGGVDARDGGVRGGFCHPKTNLCVGCLSHQDCRDLQKPVCGVTQTCVACADPAAREGDCAARNPALPVCHEATGTCEQCVRTSDCRAQAGDAGASDAGREAGVVAGVCAANKCVECTSNADCTTVARSFCLGNTCMGCASAGPNACTGARPLCATSGSKAGQCVECTGNEQCLNALSPICDSHQCRGCRRDSECSAQAGVCALDGSCPKSHAITYVQSSSRCTSTNRGQGTADVPYCDLDAALASANVSIVRITGTVAPAKALSLGAQSPLLIIGASTGATTINPPSGNTDPVVTITGGEVTLRGLTITGGRASGISVSAGTVHIDRCYVLNNAGTGIVVGDGVAFDITNTVIAGNGGTSTFGVTLGSYAGTGSTRFAFNTVVNNGRGGVVCAAGYSLSGILANNNGALDFSANCITDATSSTAAPGFGSNYHLTATSPCVNAGGSSCTLEDLDGEPRPKGSACDCGADEF